MHAVHDETSISYNLKAHSQSEDMMHGFKGRDFQLLLSPERIGIYGDSEWRSFMLKAIRNAVSSPFSASSKHTSYVHLGQECALEKWANFAVLVSYTLAACFHDINTILCS